MNHKKCEFKMVNILQYSSHFFSKWLPNNKINIFSKVFIFHGIMFCYYEISFSAFWGKEVSSISFQYNISATFKTEDLNKFI